MTITGVSPSLLSPRGETGSGALARARQGEEFGRLVRIAEAQGASSAEAQQTRSAAEEFVAIVLVEPILARVRESSQAAPPFAPTNGEKQFRSMLDANLARELTRAARFPLVDRLARDLRGDRGPDSQSTLTLRA